MTSIVAYARWEGLNILNDYTTPSVATVVPHPLPGGVPDVRRMAEAARTEDHRQLIVLCGLLGLRVSEALAVCPEHFDVRNTTLVVRGKGDVTRAIPVSEEALGVLAFSFLSGRPGVPIVRLGDRGARAYISRLGKKVLGHHVASHDLRMTFGTAVNDAYGLRMAQMLLGHASSKTTESYTLVTLDAMRKAVNL